MVLTGNDTLPRMGLGLAALGRPGYINLGHGKDLAQDFVIEAMERRTHRMLDLAYEQGVRYFDAARSYGRAEQFLASWLQENKPQDVVVGSKWGYYYTADWQVEAENHEIKEHSLELLDKQWAISAQLLPWLQLYQIHSATFESGVLDNKDVLNRLAELKVNEVQIGLSVSGEQQAEVIEKAMQVRIDGEHLFDSVQATYNVLEQSAAGILQQAHEAGMFVIVKEGLANGRLTIRNNKADFEPTKALLSTMANQYDVGMDALSLAFILSRPWVSMVLSGAATEAHLMSNLSALHLPLRASSVLDLEKIKMERKAYWEERSKLKWN